VNGISPNNKKKNVSETDEPAKFPAEHERQRKQKKCFMNEGKVSLQLLWQGENIYVTVEHVWCALTPVEN
jgi:hypothetical protein